MTKFAAFALAGALAFPALAAADVQPIDDSTLQKATARACQRAERALLGFEGECTVTSAQRRVLAGDIAEYSFDVRVGAGPYDVIGVHRVVRESAPNTPVKTGQAVLFAHGDIWNFDAAFLSNPQQALPVFLAQNGLDVWGIDFRWTRVPVSVTDFTFMKDWGIEQDARDLYVALSVARAVRLYTGNGFDRIHLLAWSKGGQIGYAYLNNESQIPAGFRNVAGFIPVDIYLKTNDAGLRQLACDRLPLELAQLATGPFFSQNGALISTLGYLALTAPDQLVQPPLDALFPTGYTNRNAALAIGAATFALASPVPLYHFTGGVFDAEFKPVDLLYTDDLAFLSFETTASPFQPFKSAVDADITTCDNPAIADVTWDDNLGDIDVPVLYVGAGGGFGEYGIYTTTLLGSTDVTTHVVSLVPAEARLFDFGHADLFQAGNAPTLVWQPILDWLQTH